MTLTATFVCIIQATRFNLVLGIPDFVMYCFGSQLIESIDTSLAAIVGRIITARITPPGIEGTMMAMSTTII